MAKRGKKPGFAMVATDFMYSNVGREMSDAAFRLMVHLIGAKKSKTQRIVEYSYNRMKRQVGWGWQKWCNAVKELEALELARITDDVDGGNGKIRPPTTFELLNDTFRSQMLDRYIRERTPENGETLSPRARRIVAEAEAQIAGPR